MICAAIVAVGLLVVGLSITILSKGRPMQSDIGDNDDMKKMGIECAAAQMRREEALLRGEDVSLTQGCGKGLCGDCAVESHCTTPAQK